MAAFDVQGAKKAGYSDAEIADHLARSTKFDVAAAREAGYSDTELVRHLNGLLGAKPRPKETLLTKATGFMANVNRGLGVGDEIAGAVQGTINAVQGKANPYAQGMAKQRVAEDQFQASNPRMAALGRGIGNAGTMAGVPGVPAAAAVANASRLGNMARGAVTAGLSGAAYAAADRGTAAERLKAAGDTAINPLVLGMGAAAGALAPVAARQAPKSKVDDRLIKRMGIDPKSAQATAAEMRAAGVDPTLVDVAGERGRRVVRAVGVKSEAGGEALVANARKVSASAKPAIMDRTQKVGPFQGKTKDELVSDMFKARDNAATTNYREAYQTPVALNEELVRALSDEPGKAALRRARSAAVARMDDGRVQEIDSILNPAGPSGDALPPSASATAPQPPPINEDARGQSLLSFLRSRGGVRDDGGELAALDLGRSRGRFQKDHIVNQNGMSLEHAAEAALEAGYFPDAKINIGAGDNNHPVTPQMLLDAIRKESRGQAPTSFAQEQDLVASQRWADNADEALPPQDSGYWKSLESGIDTGKSVTAATLHRARIAMRERAQSAKQRNAGDLASGLNMRGAMIDKALEDVPQMGPANADYRAKSQALNVLGEGKKGGRADVFSTDPKDYGRWVEGLSPEAKQANKVAIRQEILDTLGGQRSSTFGSIDNLATSEYAKANLKHALGDEVEPYLAFLDAKLKQVRNASFVSPNAGSRTAVLENDLASVTKDAVDVGKSVARGDVLGVLEKAMTAYLRRGFNEKEAVAIANAAVDPRQLDRFLNQISSRQGSRQALKVARSVAANPDVSARLRAAASARLSTVAGTTGATSRQPSIDVQVEGRPERGVSYGR